MCGNFGIIFLDPRFRDKVLPLLREMIRITMMRGAQSAGIATHQSGPAANTRERLGFVAPRRALARGERQADGLSALVMRRLAWDLRRAAASTASATRSRRRRSSRATRLPRRRSRTRRLPPAPVDTAVDADGVGVRSGSGAFMAAASTPRASSRTTATSTSSRSTAREPDQPQQLLPPFLHHPLLARRPACRRPPRAAAHQALWMASCATPTLRRAAHRGQPARQHCAATFADALKAISAVFEKAWAAHHAEGGTTHHQAAAEEEA